MNRQKILLTVLAGCLILAATLIQADDNSIVAYESSTLWGYAYDVAVSGDYAFYLKKYGLEVADISDPASPVIVARVLLDNISSSICISGTLAYLGYRDGGLSIVDIADPFSPYLIGYLEIEGWTRSITVSGNVAILSMEEDGVYLVNVANPAAPSLYSSFKTIGDPRRVAVSGTTAYIAQVDYGLQIIDFSNPSAPYLVGSFEGIGSPNGTDYRDVVLYGTFAFIADYAYSVSYDSGGFQILNVSDPSNPEFVAVYDLHLVNNLCRVGTTLYISTQTTGIHSYDITYPPSPVLLDSNDDQANITEMVYYNDHLITGGRYCEIYDVTDPSAISLDFYNPAMSEVHGVFISDNYAYICHWYSGFTIVDISDPTNPMFLSNHATASRSYAAEVRNQMAYVTTATGMEIFDVADPSNPSLLGSFMDSDSCGSEEFHIIGNTAYIAGYPHEVYIVDVTDPANPSLINAYAPDPPPVGEIIIESIDIIGNYAYISDRGLDVVHIVDISDPMAIEKVGEYTELYHPMKANFIGNYAYLCGWTSGTDILDVSDPVNPVKTGHIDAESQYEPGLIGEFIFFEDGYEGFDIYNIADPANPEYIGKFDTPGSARSVKPYGDHIYIADDDAFLIMSMNLPNYKSGDANGSGSIDVADAVYLINFIFKDGPPPDPFVSGDANCDGDVNVGDAVYIINYVFNGGPQPCY